MTKITSIAKLIASSKSKSNRQQLILIKSILIDYENRKLTIDNKHKTEYFFKNFCGITARLNHIVKQLNKLGAIQKHTLEKIIEDIDKEIKNTFNIDKATVNQFVDWLLPKKIADELLN